MPNVLYVITEIVIYLFKLLLFIGLVGFPVAYFITPEFLPRTMFSISIVACVFGFCLERLTLGLAFDREQ